MIHVLTEINGYVVAVLESPTNTVFDMVNLRKDFMSAIDEHTKKKPFWIPNHDSTENRHEEYKAFLAKVREWEAEKQRILKSTCHGEKDITDAFVSYLVESLGFKKLDPFEQTELS